MTCVPPRLTGLLTAQHGLVTTAQARDHGVEPRHLLRAGAWVAVRTGVYASSEVWEGASPFHERPLLRVRAALLTLSRECVVTHESAALLHGLPVIDPERVLVHVTRPGLTRTRTRAGVRHHHAPHGPEHLTWVGGVAVSRPERAVCDVARESGLEAGVVLADAVLRRGLDRRLMVAVHEAMASWPGVAEARAAVAFADVGAESPHESLARVLVAELGAGEVDTQFPVVTPRGTVWCDLRVGNHVFEADGRQKYVAATRGGLRTVGSEEYLWDEKVRERLLRDAGLGVSRIFWADHRGGPAVRAAARRRLSADMADTAARFGPDLAPHLARNADLLRAARPRVPAVRG